MPVKTTAVVSRIEVSQWRTNGKVNGEAYVDYTIYGEEFKDVPLDFFSMDLKEGDRLTIFVDSEKPYKIASEKGGNLSYLLFGFFGGCFVLIAFFTLRGELKKIKTRRLIKNGYCIKADVTGVVRDPRWTVNGVCRHQITLEPQVYTPGIDPEIKTGNIYEKECLNIQPGHIVNIYIDEKDSKKYYIDFENFS
jgi:bifunctional DNA-binding transcriptional regulator/antitoxin component of YhaV-PrlF toxin-antitoxin module